MKFKKFLLENIIKIPEDEFDIYNNKILINNTYSTLTRQWLLKQRNFIDDEFIIQAIDELILSYDNKDNDFTGLNFIYDNEKMSVYSGNGMFYFSSDEMISINKIKSIIEV
jgi:hypothetical protein